MRMLDENDKLLRSDVHPLALVESDDVIMECACCELPVPEEMKGNIYCTPECEEKAMEEALWNNALEEAKAVHAALPKADIFAQMFPSVVRLPEPGMPICSCPNH